MTLPSFFPELELKWGGGEASGDEGLQRLCQGAGLVFSPLSIRVGPLNIFEP